MKLPVRDAAGESLRGRESVATTKHRLDPDRLMLWWLRALALTLVAATLVLFASSLRRAIFLALTILLGFLPFAYARRRLHRSLLPLLAPPGGGSATLVAFTAVSMACDALMVAQLVGARASEPSVLLNSSALAWVGPVWFSAHALLFLAYGAFGLGRGLRRIARRRPVAAVPEIADVGPSVSRRGFLRQASVVGVGVPFGVSLSGVNTSYDFRVEHRDVELEGWPRELDGLRVAHLSDIHVGGAMDRSRLLRIAELTQTARPDLVLHTGDFLTHRSGDFDEPLYEALARIQVPHGQWACLGNHDYDDAPRLVSRLARAGVTTLRDEVASIDVRGHPLEIGGLEFVSSRIDRVPEYERVLAPWSRKPDVPRLLLNHDPRAFRDLPAACADLVLSGHHHGGHVGVQLGPDHALTVVGMVGLPDQGLFDREDMRMFVTRCVGFYGYPMRIGIPPEIALLTLRRKA